MRGSFGITTALFPGRLLKKKLDTYISQKYCKKKCINDFKYFQSYEKSNKKKHGVIVCTAICNEESKYLKKKKSVNI